MLTKFLECPIFRGPPPDRPSRTLRLRLCSPTLIGTISATRSVVGLVGAVAADRVVGRFGIGRAMVGVAVLLELASLLLPAAGGPPVALVSILVLAWLLRGLALPMFNVTLVSLRQAITPD